MNKSPVDERIGQGAIVVYALIATIIMFFGIATWAISRDPEPKHYVECAVCHEEIDNYAREIDGIKGPVCGRCDR